MSDLDVSEQDLMFAEFIVDDFAEFEEGITDIEKMAQWVRNVRETAERGAVSPRYLIDWDEKLRQRFPNGVTPQDTPLMRLVNQGKVIG